MKRVLFGFVAVALLMLPSKAAAAPIDLYQWIFNVDGTLYDSDGFLGSSTLPGSFSTTPSATGAQGLLQVSITGTGSHDFVAFYDYELDQSANGFSNEYATTTGTPGAGQSWEIDEPGFVFGDIYNNVQGGATALDNSNAVPGGSPDDVSVALGWNFLLSAGQTALINILVSTTAPLSGFYISHFDTLTGTALYYSTSMAITGGGGPPPQVPESGTFVLLGVGLATLFGARRWVFRDVAARLG